MNYEIDYLFVIFTKWSYSRVVFCCWFLLLLKFWNWIIQLNALIHLIRAILQLVTKSKMGCYRKVNCMKIDKEVETWSVPDNKERYNKQILNKTGQILTWINQTYWQYLDVLYSIQLIKLFLGVTEFHILQMEYVTPFCNFEEVQTGK